MPMNEMTVSSINERAAEEFYRRGQEQEKDGNHENIASRYTVVWERRGGDWLIVHEHMSVPLSAPAH